MAETAEELRKNLSALRLERARGRPPRGAAALGARRGRRCAVIAGVVVLAGIAAGRAPCRSRWRASTRARRRHAATACRCCRARATCVSADRYISIGVRVAGPHRPLPRRGGRPRRRPAMRSSSSTPRDYEATVERARGDARSSRAPSAVAEASSSSTAREHAGRLRRHLARGARHPRAPRPTPPRRASAGRGRARRGARGARVHDAARAAQRRHPREAEGGRRDRRARRLLRLGRPDPHGQPRGPARPGRRHRERAREGPHRPARRGRARRLSRPPLSPRTS